MDEADLLGDRVAIMSHGRLECCGSPLFLKNRFGVGYTLTIVKQSQTGQDKGTLMKKSEQISSLVRGFVEDMEPLSDVGAEQSFRLPFASSSRFVSLFGGLDERLDEFGIAEYGISATTLEDVFMCVGLYKSDDVEVDSQLRLSEYNTAIPGDESLSSFPNLEHSPLLESGESVLYSTKCLWMLVDIVNRDGALRN
jgi:hypothetical protein